MHIGKLGSFTLKFDYANIPFIMTENGVKIGAARNRAALENRVMISGLRVLSPDDATQMGYQTKWRALVPTSRRPASYEELAPFVTESPHSRQHVIYLQLGDQALSAINEHPFQPVTRIPDYDRPIVELVEGVSAHLSGFMSAEPDRLTSSIKEDRLNPRTKGDPTFPEGSSVGMHYDTDGDFPVSTRVESSPRRLIVNMGPEPRASLMVVPYGVIDAARDLSPTDDGYLPRSADILPQLANRAQDVHVLHTLLTPGDGLILPASVVFHDGSTQGHGVSTTAVLFEPESRWSGDVLAQHSLFQ